MSRQRLPDRRRQVTDRLIWPPKSQRIINVSLGFSPDGQALEVFARLEKPGSDLDQFLDGAAIALSRLLQFGDRLEDIASALGRTGDIPNTVLDAILETAVRIERDEAAR